ncbi:unnamed protein product [Toxocara canis]|uniref:Uncharacterized protein n=1 Tax=Toxocara canis TaxID=6265 RepID=A0A183VEX5_TOXCA|nr:unnamed protein product [Toxocara canis]
MFRQEEQTEWNNIVKRWDTIEFVIDRRLNLEIGQCELHVANDATSLACLQVYRRFAARRGPPEHFYSEIATQFIVTSQLALSDNIKATPAAASVILPIPTVDATFIADSTSTRKPLQRCCGLDREVNEREMDAIFVRIVLFLVCVGSSNSLLLSG